MPPRMTALARFLIVVCLATLLPLAAHAQACPQPTIITDPDVCPGSTAYAAAQPPAGSTATSVTVNPATAITVQPQSKTIPRNTSTTLSVTATGTGLSYQWYRGTAGTTTSPVGTNSSTYLTPSLAKGTHRYWVRVTGTCGVVNSAVATITAN